MKTQSFLPGQTIIAEGTFGEQTFLITQGEVLICKETGKGRVPIAILKQGEVFGEMYLLDNAGFRSATVIAQSEVHVEVISRDEMQLYLNETPPIILSMTKTLSSRLAAASQEITLLKTQNNSWLKKLRHIFPV